MNKEKGRPRYPAIHAAAEKHKALIPDPDVSINAPGYHLEHLEAEAKEKDKRKPDTMRCRSCMYFVPCKFIAPPEPKKEAGRSVGRCLSIALGHCHRHAPMRSGVDGSAVWPTIYNVGPGCGDYKVNYG